MAKFQSETHVFNYVRKALVNKDIEFHYEDIRSFCRFLYECEEYTRLFDDYQFVTPLSYFMSSLRGIGSFHEFSNLYKGISEEVENIWHFLNDPKPVNAALLLDKYKKPDITPLPWHVVYAIDALTFKKDADLTDEFNKLISELIHVSGIYMIYQNTELIYIGKSINLSNRILSSLKERGGTHVSVLAIENKADIHILEPYLISKLTPRLNTEYNTGFTPSYNIECPEFSDLLAVYNQ